MNCSATPDWVTPVFNATALVAVGLSIYVMQKTEHDPINAAAPRWLQWLRRIGFGVMGWALCNAIYSEASWLSLFWVFGSGVYSLAVNALALHLRGRHQPDDATQLARSRIRR